MSNKCPKCQATLSKNGWHPNPTTGTRSQKWRCRSCGHTEIDGAASGPGRPTIGKVAKSQVQRNREYRNSHPTSGTARTGSYWYVICTNDTKTGTIGLEKGTRSSVAVAHPGNVVRLLSGYPAGMRKWIWETFSDNA